jgi:hypothetical protein
MDSCINQALKSLKNLTEQDLKDYLQKVADIKLKQGVSNTMAAQIVEKQYLSEYRNSLYRNDYASQRYRKIMPNTRNKKVKVGDYLTKNSQIKGGDNVEINIQSKKTAYFNHVFNKIDERGQAILVDGKNDFKLAKLYDRKLTLDNMPKEDQKSFSDIANSLRDWIENKSRFELVKSTAFGIGDLNVNRILKTTYNPFKLKNVDREIYAARSTAGADLDKMFPGTPLDERETAGVNFFRGQYDKVMTNKPSDIPEIKDIPNLERKSRMFVVWKDMQNYLAHEQEFGFNDSLLSALYQDINQTARQAGMSTVLGPDPAWMLKKMIDANPKFSDGVDPVDMFADLKGSIGPYSQTAAAIMSSVRAYTGATTLGLTMPLITRADWGLGLNLLAPIIKESQGQALIKRMALSLKTLVDEKGVINDPMMKKILQSFSDGIHVHIGANLRTWDDNGFNAFSSKFSNAIYKYSGQARLDVGTRLASVAMVTKNLAMMKDTPFASLPEGFQARLTRFNIGEAEWDTMRPHFGDTATVDTLDNLTDSELNEYAAKTKTSPVMARSSLYTKLYAYHQMAADENILYPGAQERALFQRGQQSGTIAGEIGLTIGQFKGFLAAYTNRILLPGLRSNNKMKFLLSQLTYVSSLAVISNGLSNVINGRPFNANPVNWDAADWLNNLAPAYFTFSSMLDKSDPSGDWGKILNALVGTPTTRLVAHAANLGINTAMLPFHYMSEDDPDKADGLLRDEGKRVSSLAGDVVPLYNPVKNNIDAYNKGNE